ncbi:MAG: preprotein translocase subunit SecY [Candidatus Taylorbacteria bacterium RIFCSPHIGHO2_01_FULL_46_22b]|uniref:Protein translocase subunit SecY n=1 Tax=Candidatus Taylorbacteria bacterium RIFCSPHIGHO2_01_FULL_46_22b TaxID=1802301 RepID=A0A1G2M2W5_9BACT|nr:MAG: preprotein translocase subunit SecY [Candidatus Taylorbacteria bacterium RIFCSPHIGHO2_01_FULL_46_22b]
MNNFFIKLGLIFKDPLLRRRALFTVGLLVVFRLLATIPIPGVDLVQLQQLFANNQFLGLVDIFSGGGFSNLSIMMLGVSPFITATIIMQLLTMVFPKLKAMYQEEGESGRMKFSQYSRLLTIPLGLIQGYGFMALLARQQVLGAIGSFDILINVIIITAGSILLMWIGELITEFGIGNGVSLIIFAGIIAGLPSVISQQLFTFDPSQIPLYAGFLIAGLAVVLGVVVVTEAERPIPVTYARRVRGMKVYGGVSTYLPLRLNQAGVIPIIFALSILLFPQMIVNFLATFDNGVVQAAVSLLNAFLTNVWLYSIFYFLLVVIFTYFYTAVTFDPHTLSTNLQKNGAFVPGVRPGQSTADFISRILTRITLVGAVFLGVVAILPLIVQNLTGISALAIGGTALLIVVSVVLDLMKKIDAQVSMREY